VSEAWLCLIGGSRNDCIYDVLSLGDRVYFCGTTTSFDDKKRGVVGCLKRSRLEWCRVLKGSDAVYKMCSADGLAVCGNFAGFIEFSSGRFKWLKGSEQRLYGICFSGSSVAVCGENGSFVKISGSHLYEKHLVVRDKRGKQHGPLLRDMCCLRRGYVVAGSDSFLVSKDSDLDCCLCFIGERRELGWCIDFGSSERDEVLGVCCDGENVYVCGYTEGAGFEWKDIIVACFSGKGELKWCRVYGTERNDVANDITVCGDYLVVVGYTWGGGLGARDGFILTLSKENGEVTEGRVVGYSRQEFSFNSVELLEDSLVIGGWSTVGYGGSTGIVCYLPRNYVGRISIADRNIDVGEWVPEARDWSPSVSQISVGFACEKILDTRSVSSLYWSPEITCSGKSLLTQYLEVYERKEALVLPRDTVDYSDLLHIPLSVEKRPAVRGEVYVAEVSLRKNSGSWSCIKLGCGGWGCAYLASRNGSRVVFKVPRGYEDIIEKKVRPTVSRNLMERIIREAETIEKLDHPNILKLLDYSEDYPLLVYEFADYGSLWFQLSSGWKPSLRDVVLIGIQIGDALRYIHSRGLVHCDIKPSNIFLVNKTAKLGDFSALVRLLSRTSRYSRFAYTPGFAAPEQKYLDLREKVVKLGYENRIDVYQLGNLLLYLLTGESVDGEDVFDEKLVKETTGIVEDDDLRKLILSTLSKCAWRRPTADEVVRYLANIYRERFQ